MRKWHRRIGLFAAAFLLAVGITGLILEVEEFLDEDEAAEQLEKTVSAYSLNNPLPDFAAKLARAQEAVKAKVGGAKFDGFDVQLKGEHPTITLRTSGAAARAFVVNADTGAIVKEDNAEHEPLLKRLHSGEVLGDAGKVLGLLWGTALLVLVLTGLAIYWQLRCAKSKAAKKPEPAATVA